MKVNEACMVSVIVPVYKVEAYLDRCVESILDQTFSDFELILVDDGSPDNCGVMCDAWAEKDSRVRVIHKENGGVSSARNAGLEAAKGEYIAFVDADDWLDGAFLERGMAAREKMAPDVFMTGSVQYTTEEDRVDFGIPHTLQGDTRQISGVDFCALLEKSYGSSCWGKLIKKAFIGDLRFDTGMSFGEDLKFVLALLDRGGSFLAVPEPLYFYRCNPESATKSTNGKKVENLTQVYRLLLAFGEARGYGEDYRQFVGRRWLNEAGYFRWLIGQSPVGLREKWKMHLALDNDPVLRQAFAASQDPRLRRFGKHPLARRWSDGVLRCKERVYALVKR